MNQNIRKMTKNLEKNKSLIMMTNFIIIAVINLMKETKIGWLF